MAANFLSVINNVLGLEAIHELIFHVTLSP